MQSEKAESSAANFEQRLKEAMETHKNTQTHAHTHKEQKDYKAAPFDKFPSNEQVNA